MRKMRKLKNLLKISGILIVTYFIISCNPVADDSQSSTRLIIVSFTGTDLEDNEVDFLQSDVIYVDSETGVAYVTGDSAKVTFTAELVDPSPDVVSSHYNDIKVTHYSVRYFRSDGKNTEGVDVPYGFTGSLSALVAVDSTVAVTFIIVREVAKLETPLLELVDGTEEGAITVTAQVDFYGHDLANNRVQATGYLVITFANFIDPEG